MCLAVVTTELADLEFLFEGLRNAWEDNPHGAGYAFVNDMNNVIIEKGIETIDRLIESLLVSGIETRIRTTDYLIHLRYASVGDKSMDNCHPFWVRDKALIHNGTVKKYIGSKTKSDTMLLSELLSGLPSDFDMNSGYSELIESLIGSDKVAILSSDGYAKVYNEDLWFFDHGSLFSNKYYTKEYTRKADKNGKIRSDSLFY